MSTPSSTLGADTGRLYLVPTPLDFGCAPEFQSPITNALPAHTLQVASRLSHWITENAKSTRAFLKRVDTHAPLNRPLQALTVVELPREVHKKGDHVGSRAATFDARPLLAPALAGHDIGLVSEAGMPAVADPGGSVVRAAHNLGIEVQVLAGPVSLMMALAASGQNGQQFAFVGYLPQDPASRTQRLRELESLALRTGQTQIFIETPYRNAALLQALLQTLQPGTRLSASCGVMVAMSGPTHFSAPVSVWRKQSPALNWELPAVFLIGA
jgi:16S rRNA (cytidine1402-2'-O)-methyltransferase